MSISGLVQVIQQKLPSWETVNNLKPSWMNLKSLMNLWKPAEKTHQISDVPVTLMGSLNAEAIETMRKACEQQKNIRSKL